MRNESQGLPRMNWPKQFLVTHGPPAATRNVYSLLVFAFLAAVGLRLPCPADDPEGSLAVPPGISDDLDRSPVDLVLAADEAWLVTANQTSQSVSLVQTAEGHILDECPVCMERSAGCPRSSSKGVCTAVRN